MRRLGYPPALAGAVEPWHLGGQTLTEWDWSCDG